MPVDHRWCEGSELLLGDGQMRNFFFATTMLATVALVAPSARADWVGAGAGAGTGLIVAGPIGAVAGGVIGGVFGKPYWGPPISRASCWTDDHLHRHCHTARW
jgi:osmotically inducible lipoprotein OsmB